MKKHRIYHDAVTERWILQVEGDPRRELRFRSWYMAMQWAGYLIRREAQ